MPVAKTAPSDPDARLEHELGQLKAEYEKLREEQVRAEQTLAHLQSELATLEEQARADYGTADPAELERMLAAMRADNARLVEEYREHIQSVREGLTNLEQGLEQGLEREPGGGRG
nr:hypothetical protein [Fundidesulfovibrio soli]